MLPLALQQVLALEQLPCVAYLYALALVLPLALELALEQLPCAVYLSALALALVLPQAQAQAPTVSSTRHFVPSRLAFVGPVAQGALEVALRLVVWAFYY